MTTRAERFARVQAYLAADGFTLLESAWRGVSEQHRYRCAHGHIASQSGASLMRRLRGKRGALECERCWTAQTLERLHETARAAGGECLSRRYRGKSAKYRLRCAVGHGFEASAASVLDGHWCARCSTHKRAESRRLQGGLKPIQDRARERGGECLSDVYNGRTAKYRFRCGQGHEWEVAGIEIMRKAWCPQCFFERRRRPNGMAELQQAAKDRGGVCLSDSYIGVKHEYGFRCRLGHEWFMRGAQILAGGWCATCRRSERQTRGLESMRALANARGGSCLSDAYIDNETKLEWECAKGHRWWSRPRQITSGNWCAQCHFHSQITTEPTRRQRRYETARMPCNP
jgi:hypothetical protein